MIKAIKLWSLVFLWTFSTDNYHNICCLLRHHIHIHQKVWNQRRIQGFFKSHVWSVAMCEAFRTPRDGSFVGLIWMQRLGVRLTEGRVTQATITIPQQNIITSAKKRQRSKALTKPIKLLLDVPYVKCDATVLVCKKIIGILIKHLTNIPVHVASHFR